MKINTAREFIDIKHPKYPDLIVRCKKLEPIEFMDLFSGFQKYQRIVAVVNPTNNELIRDANGNLETVTLNNLPASVVVDLLSNIIDTWQGLEDQNGIIKYEKDNIKYLFKKELNVPITKDKKETSQAFPDYIQEQLNKEIEAMETDIAPKTKASLKRV